MGNCYTIEKKHEEIIISNEKSSTKLTINSSLPEIYSVSKQEREDFYKTLTTPDLYKLGENDANAKRWADNREVNQFIRNQNRRAYD